MTEIKFYRGIAEKYNQELHGDGIYFATNTLQIIHDGNSYGISSQIDLSEYATKDFVSDGLCGFIKNLRYNPETGEFIYDRKTKIYTPVTNEYGEKDYIISYSDETVKFSIRSSFLGTIKGLSFKHSESGSGQLTYSHVVEKSEVLETGIEKTKLVEETVNIDLPKAFYNGESYLDGLMSGEDKKDLDQIKDSLFWKSPK